MRGVAEAEIAPQGRGGAGARAAGGQADKLPGQLSGGQQQRVAIARAIVIEPPLVLMDEPLSNLDAKLRLEMRAEIRRIHNLVGSSTIYVTHDQDEALSLADRIVVLRDGRVRQIGTPEELYARPPHADVAEFMGYRNIVRTRATPDRRWRLACRIGDAALLGTPVDAGEGDGRCRHPAGRSDAARRRPDRRNRQHRRISRPRLLRHGATAGRNRAVFPLRRDGRARRSRAARRRCRAGCSSMRTAAMSTISIPAARERDEERRDLAAMARPSRDRRRDAAGAAGGDLRGGAVHLPVSLRAGAVLPAEGRRTGWRNYQTFFSDPFLYRHHRHDALAGAAGDLHQYPRLRSGRACASG